MKDEKAQKKLLEAEILNLKDFKASFAKTQQELANQYGDKHNIKVVINEEVIDKAFEAVRMKRDMSDREKFRDSIVNKSESKQIKKNQKFYKDALMEVLPVLKFVLADNHDKNDEFS